MDSSATDSGGLDATAREGLAAGAGLAAGTGRAVGDGLAGDAFAGLLLPHFDAAYSFARFLTRDPSAAEDIVQEAFLRALRGFANYRGGDAKSWLLAIVRNTASNWARGRRAAPRTTEEGLEEIEDEGQISPEAFVLRQHEIEGIRQLVESLPEPFRETLVLRELEELSYRQIAEITGVPVGTVMSRLARARRMLTEQLEPQP